jgi:hypothetical protein
VPMREGNIDHVIGVDSHRDRHAAAILDPNGGLVAELTVTSDRPAPRPCWAWSTSGRRAAAAGRWRAPAATAPGWPASWPTGASG